MAASGSATAIRGAALTFTDNPFRVQVEQCMQHETDAVVIMAHGKRNCLRVARRRLSTSE